MNAMQFCLHYLGVIRQRVSCSVKKNEGKKPHRSVLWCEIFVFGHWLVARTVLTTVCGFLL